jgi:hydroxymethylbilane synthase
VDALVMAAAGLKRIGRADRIAEFIADDICVGAVAQGALGLETRADDPVREAVAFLQHEATGFEVAAERAFLKRLGGGCHIPVGARARVDGGHLRICGVVADPDGRSLWRGEVVGTVAEAAALGHALAEKLLGEGADGILAWEIAQKG